MSTKTIQGKLWSVAPQYWAQHFEPWFIPMYRHVLEHLALSEKHLVLDAGCGAGLFTKLVTKTGAEVIGIDAAPGLLQVAKKRNPQINFLEEDLEELPFTDNCFQVVTGFNSFQYSGNFEKALIEARRVLRPGGRLVIGIWDKPENSDATYVLKSIGALLPPPPPGTPGPFALSEDGKIEGILENIGMGLIHKTVVSCPTLYASKGDGIKSFMSTGPAALAMNTNSKQVVENAIGAALEPFHVSDDMYFLENRFKVFIAKK
jgi:SAM-dependent methyltransferase